MNFESWLSEQAPGISTASAAAVLQLVTDGSTVPFIARYRKEATGGLDEVAIQKVIDVKERWDFLLKRQAFIVEEIDRQKKLTPELKDKILGCFQLDRLEDLYLPYKQKRKTKATIAREAGLEPLADWIWNCGHGTEKPQDGQTLELWAFTFRNDEKEIKDATAAIAGAQDILIERLSETQALRERVRSALFEHGCLRTGKGEKAKPHSKFENYFDFHEPVKSLLKPEASHRYLAIRRGWMEEELTLTVGGKPGDDSFEKDLLTAFEAEACTVHDSPGAPVLLKAARLALKAHVWPSIESEVHKGLKDLGDGAAIQVFADNVRKLLLASPFGAKMVLGVDPGVRTGCKIALVDDSGKFLANTVMYLQSEDQRKKATEMLATVLEKGNVQAIAVGNGTAGRETEVFLRKALGEIGKAQVPVVMVSEAGASVYSASEVAREEFPELDLTVRGAISIARRLQDPLAELVKVDPKSIGVGQYQHDVSQPALKRSLEGVVESCVNQVGVNLNTASSYLLSHVAGIGPGLAKGIVEFREKNGLFKNRTALLEVPRFTKKAFEQAAGFLRVQNSDQPLDNTGVHPERYEKLEGLAQKLGKKVSDFMGAGVELVKKATDFREQVGKFTFDDIVSELSKPGRDPREAFIPFQFRDDIFELKDLQPGMLCPGIVTNVTNFGAFVDIGVHQDGLVHISQLGEKFVKDPREAVSPGDHVKVRVLAVNLEKSQISLTMRMSEKPAERERPSQSNGGPGRRSDGPRPGGFGGPRPGAPKGSAPTNRPQQKPAPQPAFNNPFASLASLKKDLPRK